MHVRGPKPDPRHYHSCAVYGDFMYLFGTHDIPSDSQVDMQPKLMETFGLSISKTILGIF